MYYNGSSLISPWQRPARVTHHPAWTELNAGAMDPGGTNTIACVGLAANTSAATVNMVSLLGFFFKKKAIVLESSVIIRCTLHSTDLLTIDEAGRFGKQDLIRS